MAIIECPLCRVPQSDKVEFCIGCGYKFNSRNEGMPDILSQLFGNLDKFKKQDTKENEQ